MDNPSPPDARLKKVAFPTASNLPGLLYSIALPDTILLKPHARTDYRKAAEVLCIYGEEEARRQLHHQRFRVICAQVNVYKLKIRHPSKRVAQTIEQASEVCRALYDSAPREHTNPDRIAGKAVNYQEQQNQLPGIKWIHEGMAAVHSQVIQDRLRRVSRALDAFFKRRLKGNQRAAFPIDEGRDGSSGDQRIRVNQGAEGQIDCGSKPCG